MSRFLYKTNMKLCVLFSLCSHKCILCLSILMFLYLISCCFSGSLFKLLACLPFHLLLLAQGTMSLLLTVHHKDHNFQQLVTSFVSNKVSLLRRATEVSILKACLSLRNNLSDTLHRNWGLGEWLTSLRVTSVLCEWGCQITCPSWMRPGPATEA